MAAAAAACLHYGTTPASIKIQQKQQQPPQNWMMQGIRRGISKSSKRVGVIKCLGLGDFIGGDLVKPDLGRWLSDVEKHKAIAIYTPHEGGYEGRYLNRLSHQGYYFLDLSARGLGDPETHISQTAVCFQFRLMWGSSQ